MILNFPTISDYWKYTNIRVPDTMDDFAIFCYSQLNKDAQLILKAYRHHFYEITLDINMGCHFQVDSFTFDNEKGLLALISPARMQSVYPSEGEPCHNKGFSLFFHQDFMSRHWNSNKLHQDYAFFTSTNSPIVKLDEKTLDELVVLFQLVQYEYREHSIESADVLRNLVGAILNKAKQNYICQEMPLGVSHREFELAKRFETIVQEEFLKRTTIKEYAHRLNISDKYLSQVVKNVTGQNALAILNSHRISYAKTLLLQTNLSSVEISDKLSFSNTAYFFTYFKKLTGQTPAQYKLGNLK